MTTLEKSPPPELFLKQTIHCNQGAIRAVRYNVDGSYCLTCASDRKIKLWNPSTGLLLKTYGGHADEVTDAAGSCDSCHIISASLDKSIIHWDVTTGQPLKRLRGHAGGINCVAFNEDSTVAISGSKDNKVMCWDVRDRKQDPIQIMADAKDCISSLISNDCQIIASSLDGSVRYYDIRRGLMTQDNIGVPIIDISQTKDGQCILAACMDDTLRLTDSTSGSLLAQYTGHKLDSFSIECGILSSDTQVITGSCDGNVIIWDLIEETEVLRIPIGSSAIPSLSTHPMRNDIMFATKREVQLWGSDLTPG